MRTEYCRTHMCNDIEKYVEEGCISEKRGEEMKRDMDFREELPAEFSALSETALRPLRTEQDPEIKAKVISQIENSRSQEQKRLYGTEPKMKKAIARFKEVEPETSEEKEVKETKKLKARQYAVAAEINNAVIWCYDHGASEESIREVFEKALVSNRR